MVIMCCIYVIIVDAMDGRLTEMKCITALKCLVSFLIAKPKKREEK